MNLQTKKPSQNKKPNQNKEKCEVYFNKLVCIICNQKLHHSDSQHNCPSRDKNAHLHII